MKILIYVEPHPIRASAFEFLNVARRFARLIANASKAAEDVAFRLAVSRPIAAALGPQDGLTSLTPDEQAAVDVFAGPWGEARIAEWLGLVDGDGPAATVQSAILDRLLDEFRADCIVIWSENGAVRAAGRRLGVPVLHCELGPTRFPFYETVYCDPAGTNGNAALRREAREALLAEERAGARPSPLFPWSGRGAGGPGAEEPAAFVPLQFADDLNTLRHSDFADPADFLKRTLPDLADQGLRAVIKGHPGAGLRPHNEAKQNEALAWAEDWRARTGADVVLLDPKCGPRRTIETLRSSVCTVTINSSVGFESMLLGAPTVAKGRAIYDAGGLLQDRVPDGAAAKHPEASAFCDRLAAVYLRGRLMPAFRFWHDDLLISLCRRAVEREGPLTAVEDAEAAIAGHPLWRAPTGEGRKGGRRTVKPSSPVGLTGEARIAPGEIVLTDDAGERALPRRMGFRACVDDRGDLGLCGRVAGWAFERETGRAPAYVLALAKGRVVAVAAPSASRGMVAAAWPEARQPVGFELAIPADVSPKDVDVALVGEDGFVQLAPAGVRSAALGWALRLRMALRAGRRRLIRFD